MLGRHLNTCEDSLTAAVFSYLLHLPASQFWEILRGACPTAEFPHGDVEPQCAFWPEWAAADTTNAVYVEPDVLLRTKSAGSTATKPDAVGVKANVLPTGMPIAAGNRNAVELPDLKTLPT